MGILVQAPATGRLAPRPARTARSASAPIRPTSGRRASAASAVRAAVQNGTRLWWRIRTQYRASRASRSPDNPSTSSRATCQSARVISRTQWEDSHGVSSGTSTITGRRSPNARAVTPLLIFFATGGSTYAQGISGTQLTRLACIAGQRAIERFATLNDRQYETPELQDDPEWQQGVSREFTQLLDVAFVLNRDDVNALVYEEVPTWFSMSSR